MDKSEILRGVLDWINTYCKPTTYHSPIDLCDGVGFAKVLVAVAPENFTLDGIRIDGGLHWVLAQNNLRCVLRSLESYYHEVLEKDVDFDSISSTVIAKKDPQAVSEMIKICELLVGLAVQCDDRATHIGKIMDLPVESQSSLQVMIESVMGKLRPYNFKNSTSSEKMSRELRLLEDKVFDAKQIASRAMDELQYESTKRRQLQDENQNLNEKLLQALSEKYNRQSISNESEELRRAVDELQSLLESREEENSELKMSLFKIRAQFEKELAKRESLEKEVRNLSDELDLAQSTGVKLMKAEAAIERYKLKLEELGPLQEHADELERQSAEYLERILQLEDDLKSSTLLKKKLEQYKNEKIEIERKCFQAESAHTIKQDEIDRLKNELHDALEAKRYFENELIASRDDYRSLSMRQQRASSSRGSGVFENAVFLTEKVARLQRENEKLKSDLHSRITGHSDVTYGEQDERVSILEGELADALKAKEERTNDAMEAKRTAAEFEAQVNHLRKQVEQLDGADRAGLLLHNDSTVRHLKDTMLDLEAEVDRLQGVEVALQNMTEQYKISESVCNEMESKNAKLERYVKEKVAPTMQKYKQNNDEAKEENAALKLKLQTEAEIFKRERQLMSSCMYNLGSYIASMNVRSIAERAQLGTESALDQQRGRVLRRLGVE